MDGKKIISEQDWLTAKQVAQFFHIHTILHELIQIDQFLFYFACVNI